MYDKIVSGDYTNEERDSHVKEYGGYNSAPPGFQEITAEEFAQSGFFTWCLTRTEHRYVNPSEIDQSKMLTPVKEYLKVVLFYMNSGDHYGISNNYWNKTVKYFKFAKCFHDWKEVSAAEAGRPAWNCYHYCVCTKCGDRWEYDSSG